MARQLSSAEPSLFSQAPREILMVHVVHNIGDLHVEVGVEDIRDSAEDERRPVPVGERQIREHARRELQPELGGKGVFSRPPDLVPQFFMQPSKFVDLFMDPDVALLQLARSHEFRLEELMATISDCKARGVSVALSIDGSKKSGNQHCDLPIPEGLFEREVFIDCGRSMLRRFQMEGETLEAEQVHDRLLLTY